ncbi:MAG TPA: MFS transporter [Acidimicrobiales bacterium]|nr:MFS transporter [Acidimicrobiales bacterium]
MADGNGRRSLWPVLDAGHWRLLSLLGWASFFEGYDFNIVTVALKPLRTSFHAGQATASLWIAVIYLGALPAVVLARRADRHGRRVLLLWSIAGYSVFTALTAAAPDFPVFVALQWTARLFLVLESALVWTVVAEELPASARGFGFGWLAMLSALGTGWSAILWGSVLHPLGASWRWLYLAALPVLFVVARLWGSLSETGRFTGVGAEAARRDQWRRLLRAPHRRRLVVLCLIAVTANLTTQATVFVVDFMQTQRHLSASAASLTLVASGALAIPVLVGAGALSDRVGRKPVVCTSLVGGVLGVYCFFDLAHGRLALFGALALVYVGLFAAWPTGTGFGSELFPTALRASGNAIGAGAKYVGQALSFVVAGVLITGSASLGRVVMLLAIGPVVAAALIAVVLPETGGRELEEISPTPVETALVVPELP